MRTERNFSRNLFTTVKLFEFFLDFDVNPKEWGTLVLLLLYSDFTAPFYRTKDVCSSYSKISRHISRFMPRLFYCQICNQCPRLSNLFLSAPCEHINSGLRPNFPTTISISSNGGRWQLCQLIFPTMGDSFSISNLL